MKFKFDAKKEMSQAKSLLNKAKNDIDDKKNKPNMKKTIILFLVSFLMKSLFYKWMKELNTWALKLFFKLNSWFNGISFITITV